MALATEAGLAALTGERYCLQACRFRMRRGITVTGSLRPRDFAMTEDTGRQSWWQTLPGILTALGGVITAIASLAAAKQGYLDIKKIPSPLSRGRCLPRQIHPHGRSRIMGSEPCTPESTISWVRGLILIAHSTVKCNRRVKRPSGKPRLGFGSRVSCGGGS